MFTESLAEFFDPDDFGEVAVYDGTTNKNVIFDRSYLQQFGVVSGAEPVALAPAADFASPIGKTLLIRGVTYTIRTREPQDDGALVLMKLEA